MFIIEVFYYYDMKFFFYIEKIDILTTFICFDKIESETSK